MGPREHPADKICGSPVANLWFCLSKWNNASAVDRIQTPLAPTDTNWTDAGCAPSDLCGAGSCTFFLRGVTVHLACASARVCSFSSQMVGGDNDRSPAEKLCSYLSDLQHGLLRVLHRHVSHSRGAERESATGSGFLGCTASALGGQVWHCSGGGGRDC